MEGRANARPAGFNGETRPEGSIRQGTGPKNRKAFLRQITKEGTK